LVYEADVFRAKSGKIKLEILRKRLHLTEHYFHFHESKAKRS